MSAATWKNTSSSVSRQNHNHHNHRHPTHTTTHTHHHHHTHPHTPTHTTPHHTTPPPHTPPPPPPPHTHPHTPPPPPEHEHSRHPCLCACLFLCLLLRLATSMSGLARGAARRRRERQLRSFLRHEELSVKMALARALHHSAQPSGPVVEEPREEAGHETYYGLRAPMPLPLGTRPAPLSEVAGPQRSDRTVRHSAVDPPFPGCVVLVQEPQAHDNTNHLKQALQRKALLREEGEGGEDACAQRQDPATTCLSRWLRCGGSGRASLPPRPQEERGRRRGRGSSPKSPSGPPHRQRRRRPCALQRRVPAVQGVLPVGASDPVHLQSVGHSCCGAETSTDSVKLCRRPEIRQVQFLVEVDAPVVAQRQGHGQTVQKTVLVPQVQSIGGRRLPFRAAEANPYGPACSKDH